MKRVFDFVRILGLLTLLLFGMVSCSLSLTGEPSSPLSLTGSPDERQSPLIPPTLQATLTPTCNPQWLTPLSEACPWLPTPEPTPPSPFPTPTLFTPPTPPAQTPTPLPLPQVAPSPAGQLLWQAKIRLQDGSLAFVLLESLVSADGSINQPFQRILFQPPADFNLPPEYDYSMWFDRFAPSPDGRYLIGIYESEGGEIIANFDLASLKSTFPGEGEFCWTTPDGHCVGASGYFYSWHPNSREVLFYEKNAPDRGLWLVNVTTGQHRLLAQPAELGWAGFSGAAISPDGQILAYSISGPGSEQIWMANADGSEPHLVLESNTSAVVYAWSPDGRYLLYSGEPMPEVGKGTAPPPWPPLWVMDREGQNRRPLNLPWETFSFTDQKPVWSPTGRYIAGIGVVGETIQCWRKGENQPIDPFCLFRNAGVYVENIETGEVQLVAPNAVDPTWSPDGSLLAVSRMDERGQVDIWMVDVNGSNLRRVTDTPEVDRYPLWLQREQ